MKKGASLIWSIVLCAVLLFIVSTMSTITISELKMSTRIDDSARAYAAAQSGIQFGRFLIDKCQAAGNCSSIIPYDNESNPFQMSEPEANGQVTYFVKIESDPIGSTNSFKIISRGVSNKVNRELEYKITSTAELTPVEGGNQAIVDSSSTGTPRFTIDNRIEIQFDYWFTSDVTNIPLGFTNGASGLALNDLYLQYDNGTKKLKIVEHHPNDPASPTSQVTNSVSSTNNLTTSSNAVDPYKYQIKFTYSKNNNASVTIKRRDASFALVECDSVNLNLAGANKSDDMTRFYLDPGPQFSTTPISPLDTTPIVLNQSGSAVAYADNFAQKGVNRAYEVVITHDHSSGSSGYSLINVATGFSLGSCDATCFAGASKTFYIGKNTVVKLEGAGGGAAPAVIPSSFTTSPYYTVTGNTTATIRFPTYYTLTTSGSPSMYGGVYGNAGQYEAGTHATITARPAPTGPSTPYYFRFKYWTSPDCGVYSTTNPKTITMSSNKTCNAFFERVYK